MKKGILILIIVLAAVLRLYRIDSYPALNADEAALGYNAYSLIETGKDEHGNPWPINFQSFNDYKPGLYVYLLIPLIKLFGLSEFVVRIPGVLSGIFSVLIFYLLTKELIRRGSDKQKWSSNIQREEFAQQVALVAALFLAISPWHIHFSRGAWEVSVSSFLLLLGLWLFILSLRKPRLFYGSLFCFVSALYTYHAARIIVPLLLAGLFIIYFRYLKLYWRRLLLPVLLSGLLVCPLFVNLFRPDMLSRASGVGIFADPGPLNRVNEQRGEHPFTDRIIPKLMHNKIISYSLAFLQNYGDHFHGEFLFLSGDDIERNKVPETGQMYLMDLIFILAGLRYVAKKRGEWRLIFFWLAISPIPAALTFQTPHALRSYNMVFPLIILNALGAVSIIQLVKHNPKTIKLQKVLITIITVMIVWGFVSYLHQYYVHMAKTYPFSSQYGVKQLVKYIKTTQAESVFVTDRYDQPYILFLFYLKYPPREFQRDHVLTPRDTYGFSTVRRFAGYYFQPIKYGSIGIQCSECIIVGTDEEIPDNAQVVNKIIENDHLYFDVARNL